MLTIAKIVDNDSVGTKVQLSDGAFSIVAHGGPAPSIGQEVDVKEFGYCVPVEGSRPHQTVDMVGGSIEPPGTGPDMRSFPPEIVEVIPNAMDAGASPAKDEGGDQFETQTNVE